MKYERVKYKLINHDNGRVSGTPDNPFLSNDPMNWNESEKTLKRSTKTYGVYTELSKDLQFAEDGYYFLKEAYDLKEIEADVTLEEWRMNPVTEEFYLHSTGTFDFSQYNRDDKYVNVPFKTGGLNALIESQFSEKFELDRNEAINGNEIPDLIRKEAVITGREILVIDELTENKENGSYYVYSTNFIRAPFLKILSGLTPNIAGVFLEDEVGYILGNTFTTDVATWESPNVDADQHFYLNSVGDETIRVRVSGSIRVALSSPATSKFGVFIIQTDASYNFKAAFPVYEANYVDYYIHDFNNEVSVDLDVSDNLAFIVMSELGGVAYTEHFWYATDIKVVVNELLESQTTQSKVVLYHEAGEKLMQILTGESGRYLSNFYGRTDIGYDIDGEYAYTGLANGFWIRQFNDKKLELSIKSFIESSNAVHNTGWTVETIGGIEKMVQEDMKYFFQDSVAIRITDQVSDIKRKAAKELFYANMTFGYKKPDGDNLYEEAMGLDEYNTQTGYTLPITKVDDKYENISEMRSDSYGVTFAQLKPKLTFPEQDTRYDSDVFLLDLKTGPGSNLILRKWEDDFLVAPLNVYSPETAFNLRLTPYRNSQRHEWFYSSGLRRFQDDYVRYANSIGNSELVTQKDGELPKAENSDTLISTLEKPRFINQWIEFTFPVDYDLNQQIYGKTEVNGRKIPNYFFKVEFINEYNKKEYGYLFELQPNKEGKWRLLKAR